MTRIAPREKLRAIVKMKLGTAPPQEYIVMKIGGDKKTGGDIYTLEAHEDELTELSKSSNVLSLEFSRPVHAINQTTSSNGKPATENEG